MDMRESIMGWNGTGAGPFFCGLGTCFRVQGAGFRVQG